MWLKNWDLNDVPGTHASLTAEWTIPNLVSTMPVLITSSASRSGSWRIGTVSMPWSPVNLISSTAVRQNETYTSIENDWMPWNSSTFRVSRNQQSPLPACPNAGLLIAFGQVLYTYLNVSKAPWQLWYASIRWSTYRGHLVHQMTEWGPHSERVNVGEEERNHQDELLMCEIFHNVDETVPARPEAR